MRVWDIPVEQLCNKHLVAQHHEIHCIYGILTKDSNGYRNHPEVKRWRGHLGTLITVHAITATEMRLRGFQENSWMPLTHFDSEIPEPWQSVEEQIELLKSKGCQCKV